MIGNDKKRHLFKTVTWRILATLITFLVALVISGDFTIALNIGLVEVVLKMAAYYAHERFWFNRIRFKKTINRPPNLHPRMIGLTPKERGECLHQNPQVVWMTGLSGSGKSTIAEALERKLVSHGYKTFILDGDNTRWGINADLGFTHWDREENLRRVAEIAKLFTDAGFIVITAFISPYKETREKAREIIGDDKFKEIHISTSLGDCIRRDVKGLYKKAYAGEIKHFTGVSDPFEVPENPFLEVNAGYDGDDKLEENVQTLYEELLPYIYKEGAN